jgi:hypothetical protein
MRTRLLSSLALLFSLCSLCCVSSAKPAKEVPVQKDEALRYKEYLTARGKPTDAIAEKAEWKSAWRYFFRSAGRVGKGDEAAIGPDGKIVAGDVKDHWHAFLSQPGVDAVHLAARVIWVTSHMGDVADPGDRDLAGTPQQKVVTKPTLVRAGDGTITLTFWAVTPPEMDTPYRVILTAPPSGPGRYETTGWEEVAKQKK